VGLYHEEVSRIRAAGFRVAAVDTMGDRADDPATAPLSWDLLARDVAEAVERLGTGRAVLWGTSFGCLVCLATAARYPSRVSGLLLGSPPEPGWRQPLYTALLDWAARRRDPARWTARLFQAGFLTLNAWEFASPVALARLPGLARAAADARTPALTIREKLELLFGEHPGLPPGDPPLPCSIVAGAWDTVTRPGAAVRLAAALPGSRLRRLRFTGHACAYARPATYACWSIEELRRLSRETATRPAGPL
jgi:pimeloyl-ACP methyl ester carboxylesterase